MSPKTQLTDMVRGCGLRLTLETIATVCVEEAERNADLTQDVAEWKAWHKAKDALLKLTKDMVL
jgi:hypothetical protein